MTVNLKTLYDEMLSGVIPSPPVWVNAFDTCVPATIKIADKPLSSYPEIQELRLSDYAQKLNAAQENPFIWTEGLLVPEEIKRIWKKTCESFQDNAPGKEKLAAYFSKQPRNLVICFIDNRVGHGVFTLEKISRGDIVTVNAGKLFTDLDLAKLTNSKYTFHLPANDFLTFDKQEVETLLANGCNDYASAMNFKSRHYCEVAAEDCGNIARFLQSFPTQEELVVDERVKKKIIHFDNVSTNNIEDFFTIYQGWPLIYFEAIRDIQPGEQLGFSYGDFYWKNMQKMHGITMAFFDREGKTILA